ncbi:UNVERIFIED_CONTAM: hypothetical protein FKN15_039207 [Acipenser sinensis]
MMLSKTGFYACTSCRANIPQENRHTLCALCRGVQHATLALEREVACSICMAFQPQVKENRLERATRASSASSVTGPSAALGAPEPLLHELSQDPLLSQAPRSPSPSPQAPAAPTAAPAPTMLQVPYPPTPRGDQGEQEESLMGRPAGFLQVPWTPAAESHWSVFRTQAMAPCSQEFLDFMEEIRSFWDCLASAPSSAEAGHTACLPGRRG